MTEEKFKVIYHPIKKEMKFARWNNGIWVSENLETSELKEYSNNKGNILLQGLGSEFFDKIKTTVNSTENIELVFKGTEPDRKDFEKMIRRYNDITDTDIFSINKNTFEELPRVDILYDEICNFCENTITLFNENIQILKDDVKLKCITVVNNLENGIEEVRKEENNINICLVGGYSSGKSYFINSLIGHFILPESLNPKTAKIFKVITAKNETIGIEFNLHLKDEIRNIDINWSLENKALEINTENIAQSQLLNELNEIMVNNSSKNCDEQVYEVLQFLNGTPQKSEGKEYISDDIVVNYPMDGDSKFTYTIYDTPGSNNSISKEDTKTLMKALNDQTNSILIVLYKPDNLSSKDDAMLAQLLNETNADKKNKIINIDLERSFYVINKADTLTIEEELIELQDGTIVVETGSENSPTREEYPLKGKKLFFVSAKMAFLAKKQKAGYLLGRDEKFYDKNLETLKYLEFYKYNLMAHSNIETEELIEDSQDYIGLGGKYDAVIGNSGFRAIEWSIQQYAEKYSLAVKAKSIFDGIISTVQKLKDNFSIIKNQKDKSKEIIKEEIFKLTSEIEDCIISCNQEYKNDIRDESTIEIYSNTYKELNQEKYNRILKNAGEVIDESKIWWGLNWVEEGARQTDSNITNQLSNLIADYHIQFNNNRANSVKELSDKFKNKVFEHLSKIKGISDEMKNYIVNIDNNIRILYNDKLDSDIYERSSKKFLWTKCLSDEYRSEKEKDFIRILLNNKDKYKKDIVTATGNVCDQLKEKYIDNINTLCKDLGRLVNEKEDVESEIENLGQKINQFDNQLTLLNKKIWGE